MPLTTGAHVCRRPCQSRHDPADFRSVNLYGRILMVLAFAAAVCVFAAAAPGKVFTTYFEGEENPVSEGGRWQNAGLDWTSVKTSRGLASGTHTGTNAVPWSWQRPQSKVWATGDLEWAPQAFEFKASESIRYVDFETGADANDGLSKENLWKHHPWDPNATGQAKACRGPSHLRVQAGRGLSRGVDRERLWHSNCPHYSYEGPGLGADVSLANDADLYVAGAPNGRFLNGVIDFLRIARGTLADTITTIEELYAWEFNGPFLDDFTGHRRPARGCAGAVDEIAP
jgi:hypothetical protein